MFKKKILWLVRHGVSLSNAGEASADPEAIPLTELGLQGARNVALKFDDEPADLIISSRMLRARHSADPWREKWPSARFEIWNNHEFVFLNFKDHPRPLTIQERLPHVTAYWARCNPLECNQGGESFEAFWTRVIGFHEKVVADPAQTIVAIGHGFFWSTFLYLIQRGSPSLTPGIMAAVRTESLQNPVHNSAIVKIEFDSMSSRSAQTTML